MSTTPLKPVFFKKNSLADVVLWACRCYHNVSRLEAMLLLERESKKGNMLLRPGSNGNSFAVTTRQDMDG